jgi:hypothetical protein
LDELYGVGTEEADSAAVADLVSWSVHRTWPRDKARLLGTAYAGPGDDSGARAYALSKFEELRDAAPQDWSVLCDEPECGHHAPLTDDQGNTVCGDCGESLPEPPYERYTGCDP